MTRPTGPTTGGPVRTGAPAEEVAPTPAPARSPLPVVVMVLATAVQPFRGDSLVLAAAVLWVTLGAGCVARPRHLRWVVPVPVLLLAAWAGLSLAWSSVPVATTVGGVQTLLTTLVAIHLAARFELPDLVRGAGRAFRILLAASWAVAVLLPSVGRTQDAYQSGALEGVFVHRNIMGYVAVLAVLTFLAERGDAPAHSRRRVSCTSWAVAALVTVLLTRSLTAVLALLVVAALLALLRVASAVAPGRRGGTALGLLVLVAAVGLVGARHAADLTVGLGRDPTLTGRTDIWAGVLDLIRERPWQGFGWNALWHPQTQPTEDLWARVGFAFFHAHDGYLDIAAQIGLVGAGLVVAVAVTALWRSARAVLRGGRGASWWPASVCLSLLVFNLTESVLAVHVGWLLLVIVSTHLLATGQAQRTTEGKSSWR